MTKRADRQEFDSLLLFSVWCEGGGGLAGIPGGAFGFGGVVAGADREGGDAVGSDEGDGVESAVVREGGGAEDEAVLVAQVGLDGAEVGEEVGGGGVVVAEGAAGLVGELREGFGAGGGRAVVGVRGEGVDGGVGALAAVDGRFEVEEAGVVFAVGEKKEDVAAGAVVYFAELVAAGGVESVEERGAADGVAVGGGVDGGDEGGGVVGPGLEEVRGAIEVGDEGLVGLLTEDVSRVFRCDGLVAIAMRGHGAAGVDEDAGADGEVLLELEVEDAGGRVAIVEQGEVGEGEVVDGEAVGVGCVEGEDDFVDGDAEAIGGVGLRSDLRGEEGAGGERESGCEERAVECAGRSHEECPFSVGLDGGGGERSASEAIKVSLETFGWATVTCVVLRVGANCGNLDGYWSNA